jgi:thiamine biosynthesis lipoprotein
LSRAATARIRGAIEQRSGRAGDEAGTAGGSAGANVHRFERRAMGSPLRLTLVEVGDGRAAAAWASVSAAIERAEQALSRHRAGSALTALNRWAGDPTPRPVGRALAAALAAGDRAHRLTAGAFDPRVLADMERLGWAGAALPGAGAAAARAEPPSRSATFADGRWLYSDPRAGTVAIAAPVDLGGIGKGLALRWAFAALRTGLPGLGSSTGALLEAGGDLVVAGRAPQPGPWLIGIENPLGGPSERAVTAIDRGAVCTSSVRVNMRLGPDGRPVHHLLDPRTGEPGGAGLLAVTVAGPDPAWAEVWAKALFLEGARGIGAAARARDLAAWWITSDGTLEMTASARQLTAWDG